MQLDSRFVKVAHDPGDPVLCSHCPFCGSGQITGRSDGGIDCAFCGQSFIVRVQPAFPGMPQAPGMGAPTDIGPDMMGGMPGEEMPPGMEDEGGLPPGMEDGDEEDEGAPPFGDGEGEEDASDEAPPFGGGGDSDASDSGPPPPSSKGKGNGGKSKSKSKKESARRYRTVAGDELTEDQYVRHLAVLFSGGHPRVLATLRREAQERPWSSEPGGYSGRDPLEGPFMSGRQLTDYSDERGYAKSPRGPDYDHHYNRGWRASQGYGGGGESSPLERADLRGEPDAWYHGYMDYATDRPKWHSRDCPAPDHDTGSCTLMREGAAGDHRLQVARTPRGTKARCSCGQQLAYEPPPVEFMGRTVRKDTHGGTYPPGDEGDVLMRQDHQQHVREHRSAASRGAALISHMTNKDLAS